MIDSWYICFERNVFILKIIEFKGDTMCPICYLFLIVKLVEAKQCTEGISAERSHSRPAYVLI